MILAKGFLLVRFIAQHGNSGSLHEIQDDVGRAFVSFQHNTILKS